MNGMYALIWIVCNFTVSSDVIICSLRTRNDLLTLDQLTISRNQVLRFNLTCATSQPSGIDTEGQFTICFIFIPDTSVINSLRSQVRVPLIHQVFLTNRLNEIQAIC